MNTDTKPPRRGPSFGTIVKVSLLNMAAGAAICGWLGYQHVIKPRAAAYETVINRIASGWCGQRDIEKTFYLFSCQDSYIAAQLRTRDIETDRILAEMATSAPIPARKAKGK